MSYLKRNSYSEKAIYNVVYENMKGVDFSESGTTVQRNRFAYLENMYRDYEGDGKEVIESIPGYPFTEKIAQKRVCCNLRFVDLTLPNASRDPRGRS